MAVSRDYFISENNFRESMQNIVEPYLKSISEDGYFEAADGKMIHYIYYRNEDAVGDIVMVHGFTEFAEKFFEMCYYFSKMKLNVFFIEHRGHGLSHRHNDDKEVVHIKYFDQYIDDLHTFIKSVVLKKSTGLPLYLYSHSMGGAISVRYLQKHSGVFSKAILSSPMVKAKTAGLPAGITRFFTRFFIILGKEKNKVIGYKGFDPDKSYENSNDTSKARFEYYHKKRIKNENIRTAAPSYRWVNEAVRVTEKILDPEKNKEINAKILLCQPEEDSTVYMEPQNRFIKLVKDGRLMKFPGSRHSIYNSVDPTVKEYLDAIEGFLCE